MSGLRVLVVEDEQKVANALREGLEGEKYDVVVERTGEGAFFRVTTETFDVILLDLGLPGRSGLEILAALRERGLKTPVLVLTARDSVQDRVLGLDGGADDYLVKPFAFAELVARIRALVRRGRATDSPRLTLGDLDIDLVTRKVTRAAKPIDLTVREFELLEYLLRHNGQVVSREALARDVWRETARTTPLDNVIDVHIARLRRKVDVEPAVKLIHTVRGVGFMLREGRAVIDPIRWWHSHSVRMRLAIWYVAAMVVVLAVYATAIYAFVSRSVSESLDQRLRADFFWAAATVDEGPDGLVMSTPQVDLLLEEEPWVQVWNADSRELLLSNGEARRRPIAGTQALAALGQDRTATFEVTGVRMRVLSRRSFIGERPVVVQVGRSEETMEQQLSDLTLVLLLGLPLAVGVAGLGGYVLARRALAPIEQMTERARTITAERLSDRLPVKHPDDEMGRLASVFNETLARLEGSFEQMRRFTADVSHELRTPLTSIRSVGEVGLRGHKDEPAYRGIIESMLEEVDRLAGLVDRLLTLSRAETGEARLSREIVDLQSLADEVVQHLSVLAEEKQQQIVVERRAAPDALADRQVLRHALINLVDNAIKFTPRGGAVRIRISETPASAIFDVIDSGPGVPDDAQARIFERFYRADQSDGVHGAGLGLSIAKGAVEANGGRLTLEASGPGGSVFRITMPRVAPARRQAG